jgi:apolipoprotein D and lipocalin family protein
VVKAFRIGVSIVLAGPLAAQSPPALVQAIDTVDLARYAGRWYEVARFANQFQDDCVAGTMANYTLLPNGEVQVINQCLKADGSTKLAEGRARLAERGGPTSKLEVRFAPRILSRIPYVWGDYWVLNLTEDYSAALVGTPDRKYLWILSRTPVLEPSIYDRMVASATRQGFAVNRLMRSPPAPD